MILLLLSWCSCIYFSLNYKLKHPNAKILMIDGAKNIAEHFKSTDYLINSQKIDQQLLNQPMFYQIVL